MAESKRPSVIGREQETGILASFLSKDPELLAPALVVSGYKSIGKTHTVGTYLRSAGIGHTFVQCDECITKRLLLQRCLKRVAASLGPKCAPEASALLCEGLSSFMVTLEGMLAELGQQNHVLVLDRFDQCIEHATDLFVALLRLHETSRVQNLSIVFITSSEDPSEIITNPVPHVFFRPYSVEEVVEILQQEQLCFFDREDLDGRSGNDFWKQYAKIIVDLFFAYTGSDLVLLTDICKKLWGGFIAPVLDGTYAQREFVKVYRESRALFNNDNIINNSSIVEYSTLQEESELGSVNVSDLTYHCKFILIASYLASFVEPKHDLHFFSRIKANKGKVRRRNTAKAKNGYLSKDDIDNRLLSPNYFDLERLRAIVSVIYRNEAETLNKSNLEFSNFYQDYTEAELAKKDEEFAKFTFNPNIDMNSLIATLASLGLITRTYALDVLSSKIRWKCNLSWPMVEDICTDINFPILHYLSD